MTSTFAKAIKIQTMMRSWMARKKMRELRLQVNHRNDEMTHKVFG
jgi:hypothetical protein